MDLKEKWVASFEAFPHKDDILKDIRKEALSFFAEKGFPHKKKKGGNTLHSPTFKLLITACGSLFTIKQLFRRKCYISTPLRIVICLCL